MAGMQSDDMVDMASDDKPIVHTIAKNGDLMLEVGGSDDKVQLLVNSQILTLSSKPFNALLGPDFVEAQSTKSPREPQTICLPEDNPQAMQFICRLLHGVASPEELRHVASNDVLTIACHISRYDLSQALQFHSQALLLAALDSRDQSELGKGETISMLVLAAYLMARPECFKIATRCLATEAITSVASLLPGDVQDAIEYKRSTAREKVAYDVPHLLAPRFKFHCTFADAREINLTPVFKAFRVRFWPARRFTIQEAITNVQKLVGCEKARCGSHHSPNRSVLNGDVTASDVNCIVQELTEICEGLCYHCVREGKDLRKKCHDHQHRV